MKHLSIPGIAAVLLIFFAAVACKTKKEVMAEPVKDINGTWRIALVTRNTVDITPYVDSAMFRLTLGTDKSYTLQGNNLPFVVNGSGSWAVDDPQYPYNLSFTPKDSSRAVPARIGTPVSKGVRNLEITFSPGCPANTYVYTFEKIY